MGKLRGFLEYDRKDEDYTPVKERVKHFKEFTEPKSEKDLKEQGGRCMDCGIPFCHSGCPLGNLIPDFNDAVYRNNWREALDILHATNNFPEFTGRLCPAPCESSCVLGIISPPVSIELIEKNIVERGFSENWIMPIPPKQRTGKKIAIVGSGPAGLAAAQQLNRAGHLVTVFERDPEIGGLLRYGIPNFKLDKTVIDRRLKILKDEGIIFKTNIEVGNDFSISKLKKFDAIVLTGGATVRRDMNIEGHNLDGVVQAMDFLKNQNLIIEGRTSSDKSLSAKDKHIIVIGGGDTGSDCIGTSNRHGAKSVVNFEIMDKPPKNRTRENPWPYWPFTYKDTTSHKEGVQKQFAIYTKSFIGDEKGHIKALKTVDIEIKKDPIKGFNVIEKENTEKIWDCDMAILALGFVGPEKTLSEQLGISIEPETSKVLSNQNYQTNIPHIFTAGDMRRGQSLIVWAISEGREAAYHVDKYLMGYSNLPQKEKGDLPSVR